MATSGSIVLELGVAKVPCVVVYNTNWPTKYLIKRMVSVKFASIPNIIANREIIPEFLFENCNPDKISAKVTDLLNSPHEANKQLESMNEIMKNLVENNDSSPSIIAAETLIQKILSRLSTQTQNT